jgi:hypothetical protein
VMNDKEVLRAALDAARMGGHAPELLRLRQLDKRVRIPARQASEDEEWQ